MKIDLPLLTLEQIISAAEEMKAGGITKVGVWTTDDNDGVFLVGLTEEGQLAPSMMLRGGTAEFYISMGAMH